MQLLWTPHAYQAREAAIDYIALQDPIAALGQLDEIERQTDMLMQYPEMGRIGRVQGTCELIISRTPFFIVVYRLRPTLQRIELIRFLHSVQQWPRVAQTHQLP